MRFFIRVPGLVAIPLGLVVLVWPLLMVALWLGFLLVFVPGVALILVVAHTIVVRVLHRDWQAFLRLAFVAGCLAFVATIIACWIGLVVNGAGNDHVMHVWIDIFLVTFLLGGVLLAALGGYIAWRAAPSAGGPGSLTS